MLHVPRHRSLRILRMNGSLGFVLGNPGSASQYKLAFCGMLTGAANGLIYYIYLLLSFVQCCFQTLWAILVQSTWRPSRCPFLSY